jgi:hypothetical protein
LAPKLGLDSAVKYWTGPQFRAKDFQKDFELGYRNKNEARGIQKT